MGQCRWEEEQFTSLCLDLSQQGERCDHCNNKLAPFDGVNRIAVSKFKLISQFRTNHHEVQSIEI